jgi:hypothetical protein
MTHEKTAKHTLSACAQNKRAWTRQKKNARSGAAQNAYAPPAPGLLKGLHIHTHHFAELNLNASIFIYQLSMMGLVGGLRAALCVDELLQPLITTKLYEYVYIFVDRLNVSK